MSDVHDSRDAEKDTETTVDPSEVCTIVWIDSQMKEEHNQKMVCRFLGLVKEVKPFDEADSCLQFFERCRHTGHKKDIILITSGALARTIIPKVHDHLYIQKIFIFCYRPETLTDLNYSKLEQPIVKKSTLIKTLKSVLSMLENKINFSLYYTHQPDDSSTDANSSTKEVNRNSVKFLWFSTYHKIMMQMSDSNPAEVKTEFLQYCQEQNQNDEKALKIIARIKEQTNDQDEQYIFRLYTKNCFLYRQLNSVLSDEKFRDIYRHRYFIRLLCEQIGIYYNELRKTLPKDKLILYRGQATEEASIREIKKFQGHLISFNSFLSTTREENVAKLFAKNRATKQKKRVVFRITIDTRRTYDRPFADISNFSTHSESEIIFTIGSVFRIDSVHKHDAENTYYVDLTFTNASEHGVNDYLKRAFGDEFNPNDLRILFGRLLFEMEQYDFATDYFKELLTKLPESQRSSYSIALNNMGLCYLTQENYQVALRYFERAKTSFQDDVDKNVLAICLCNIASCYEELGKLKEAESSAMEATKIPNLNEINFARTQDRLGSIYEKRHQSEAARNMYQNALDCRLRFYSNRDRNHPSIGDSYTHLGFISSLLSDWDQAIKYYSDARDIYRHTFPENSRKIQKLNKSIEVSKQKRRESYTSAEETN